MANLADILDRPISEIKPPLPFPAGTYLVKTTGIPRYDKTQGRDGKEGTDFYEFTYTFISAMDDVDKEALAELEGGLVGKQIKERYWITEASLYRLKNLLEHCGFDVDEPGVSIKQVVEASAGSQIYITIRNKPSQDGKTIRSEVSGTAKVE